MKNDEIIPSGNMGNGGKEGVSMITWDDIYKQRSQIIIDDKTGKRLVPEELAEQLLKERDEANERAEIYRQLAIDYASEDEYGVRKYRDDILGPQVDAEAKQKQASDAKAL